MATSKRLAAHREAVRAGDAKPAQDDDLNPDTPGEEDEETGSNKPQKKDGPAMDEETKAAIEAARTEGQNLGFKSASERINTVFASDHYAGREAFASKLLGKENLSAEDIIDLLGTAPKGAAPEASADAIAAAKEEGQREAMMTAATLATSNVDPNGGEGSKKAADPWAKITAELNPKAR